jgi:hypothetical protein
VVDRHGRSVRARVRHCATHDDLLDTAADEATVAIVVDLFDWPSGGASELTRRLDKKLRTTDVYALHGLSHLQEIDALGDLLVCVPHAHSVYRKYHELGACLRQSPYEWVPSATSAIVRELGAGLTGGDRRVLVCCVVEGERHTTLARLAACAGVTERRAESIIARLGFTDWCAFRAHVRVLHAVHRMERYGASAATAGMLAGFTGRHSLENHTERWNAATPQQLEDIGFDRLISEGTRRGYVRTTRCEAMLKFRSKPARVGVAIHDAII